ncbi:MAG: hypothetical protein II620_05135, partial [Paludibacteraceae bacterium]|nr:hypothetical protein [Paludibacteraceae bacterium]
MGFLRASISGKSGHAFTVYRGLDVCEAQKSPISACCLSYKREMPDRNTLAPEVLNTLLRDHTTGKNIFWATHDYEELGSEYSYRSPILPELITGERGKVIRPRV